MLAAFYIFSHGRVSISSHVLGQLDPEINTEILSARYCKLILAFMVPSVIINVTLPDDLADVYFV